MLITPLFFNSAVKQFQGWKRSLEKMTSFQIIVNIYDTVKDIENKLNSEFYGFYTL